MPMSLSNGNYYGYAARLLVREQVTWLECAAASISWSTILVYYLEEPYGHFMLESVEGASARTQVRGNFLSFGMPWGDIERCCAMVTTASDTILQQSSAEIQRHWQKMAEVPHAEGILATLLNVHVVGGSKDLAVHLEGATMRPKIVEKLIGVLRETGYPGYEEHGPGSRMVVRRRIEAMYVRPCRNQEEFVPREIQ